MIVRPNGAPQISGAGSEQPGKWFPAAHRYTAATLDRMEPRQFKLALLSATGPGGQAARNFIEARYLEMFGSQARVRYPSLLVLTDDNGDTVAALGIRRASEGPLFLEQYLDDAAEQAIASATGASPTRDSIVELGSFAARSSRAATYLVAAMATYMEHQRFSHALVTSTGRLRRLFALFDFNLSCLGEAHKDALPDGGNSWGLYYDDAPRVLAGSVADCYAAVLRERDRQPIAARRNMIDSLIIQARAL